MKKVLVVLISIILVTGCASEVEVGIDNNVEENKITYLDIKDKLTNKDKFITKEELEFDVTASVDRISEEEVSYRVIIDNPTVNMNNIEALLIHNNFTEDIFPSIGIFDDKQSLLVDNKDLKGIELVGYIETTKKIKELNLELRLWLSYIDDEGNKQELYYKIEDVNYNDKIEEKQDNSTQDVIVE